MPKFTVVCRNLSGPPPTQTCVALKGVASLCRGWFPQPGLENAVAIYRMGNRHSAKIPGKWERKWKIFPCLKWLRDGHRNGERDSKMGFWPFHDHFLHSGGHFSAISGPGPFSMLFPIFPGFFHSAGFTSIAQLVGVAGVSRYTLENGRVSLHVGIMGLATHLIGQLLCMNLLMSVQSFSCLFLANFINPAALSDIFQVCCFSCLAQPQTRLSMTHELTQSSAAY